MEEISDNNIDIFASRFDNLQRTRPDGLPAASIYQNKLVHTPGNVIKVKDVISEVSKQMKDIQDADCAGSCKKPPMILNKYKKSTFVSVNMMSALQETYEKTAQSEASTQLVLDTQLINVMQDAEALGTAGLTQEFQSTFPHPGIGKEGEISKKNPTFPMLDISLKEPEPNEFYCLAPTEFHDESSNLASENTNDNPENVQNNNDEEEAELVSEHIIFVDKHDLSIEFGTVKDLNDSKHEVILIRENSSEIDKIDTEVDCKQILNEKLDIETNEKDVFILDSDETDMPSSPVLSVKSLKMSRKSSTPSPIVIDLETFEKFEELTSPLLININDETENDLLKLNFQISPKINELEPNDYVSPKINTKQQSNDVSPEINEKGSQSILEPMDIDCETNTNILEHAESKHVITEDLILAGSNLDDNYKNVTLLAKTKELENCTQNMINHKPIDQKYNDTITPLHNIENSKRFRTIDTNDISKELLKDEILFSSDEEEEYINIHKNNQSLPQTSGLETHKHNQDLPLTCVLDTSFCDDQSDVLDKTMYVGFQTASNKSIKVLTDSFCRAKSFLSEDLDPGNEISEKTVTDLVNICSTKENNTESVNAKDSNNVSKSDKISRIAQGKELLEIDKIFENKLEEIKDRITNTICSDIFFTCDDNSSGTESLEITVPEKFNKAQDELNKLNAADLLAIRSERSLNDSNYHVTITDHNTNNAESMNTIDFSPKNTENINKNDFEANSQIISFSKSKDTVTDCSVVDLESSNNISNVSYKTKDNVAEVLPMSQVLITTKNKQNNTKSKTKINIDNIESHYTEANTFTDNSIAGKVNCRKKIKNMSKTTMNSGKEADTSSKNQVNTISIESVTESDTDSFPSSQIISLKSIKPSHKRKNYFPQTENKKLKLSENVEIQPKKIEIHVENEFEDMDFDTCDLREILIQENLKKKFEKDQVDSRIFDNISPVVKTQSPDVKKELAVDKKESPVFEEESPDFKNHDLHFDIREMLIQENLNKLLSDKTGLIKGPFHQNATKIDNVMKDVNIGLNMATIVNTDTDINNTKAGIFNIDENVQDLVDSNLVNNESPKHYETITQTKEILKNIKTGLKPNANTEEINKNNKHASINIPDNELRDTLEKTKLLDNTKIFRDMKNSPKNSQNIETMSENSEEPPFMGFSNIEDKMKALEEIAKCKKIFEEYNFDQSIFEQSYLNNDCEENLVNCNLEMVKPENLKDMNAKTGLESNFNMKLKNKNYEADLEKSLNLKMSQNLEMSTTKEKSLASQSNRNVSINVEVEGSKTQNYEQIKMSEEALTKLEYYFKDMDKFSREQVSNRSENVSVFQGFKTASRKPIKISERALTKSRKLFHEIYTKDSEMPKATHTVKEVLEYEDFKSPSKKPIKMYPNALKRAKKIFQNIDKDFCESNKPTVQELKTRDPVYKTPVKKSIYDIKSNKYSSTKKELDEISTTSRDSCSERSIILGSNKGNKKPVQVTPKSSRTKKMLESIVYSDDDECDVFDSTLVNTVEGFKTACNKDVEISEKSLENIRKLFQDINSKDLETPVENLGPKVITKTNAAFQGFQTASNKQINISTKALEKGKKLFQDIDTKDSEIKNSNTEFQGFQTESNKRVGVSESTLEKSRKIVQNIDQVNQNFPEAYSTKKIQGFRTGRDKEIKISKEALAKSRKLFYDIDTKSLERPDDLNNQMEKVDIPKTTVFQGFKTASNKQVEISKKALIKSRQLFQDIDSKGIKMSDHLDNQMDPVSKTTVFQGFQTASNKQIKISEKALIKSRQLFQDIDTRCLEMPDDFNNQMDDISATVFQGFQTASNKQVNVSEKALIKGRWLFQDIETRSLEMPDDFNNQMDVVSKTTVFQGFRTGSNKEIKISEEALAKSKKVFDTLEVAVRETVVSDTNSFKFEEFQTGSNKKVEISAEALEKSGKIFQSVENNPEPINVSTFQGFTTANKKNVTISKEALEKSKKILQKINSEHENFNTTRDKEEIGFKSASDNKISVSKDALSKSRKLLSCNEPNSSNIYKIEATKLNTANISVENIINTQVLNNFEETLHSEDFFKECPKSTKRPGSPILSCPKAKKKKRFAIPYSQNVDEAKNIVEKYVNKPKLEGNIVKFENTYKKSKIYTLKDLQKLEKDDNSTENNLSSYILNFDFENLLEFEFVDERNDLDKTMNRLKVQDLTNLFEVSVNTKLIPKGWTENHVKLILWKLISYEMKFPKTMKNACTAKNVIEQLKYRYDKELFNAERPVLRKILEKDDIPGKTMILCVVAFFVDGVLSKTCISSTKTLELLLTDGWYTIRCTIDKMLTALVHHGKIKVGMKIATCGAELIGDEQGISPWEDTSSIRLKLHGNSTRLARWDARLGCHGNAAILSKLTAVKPDGGKVGKLRCVVTRVYPALYVDRFTDGSTVTRSERLEHLHQMKYEAERQALMEKLYEDVEKEFADQESQDSSEGQTSSHLDSGSQIARMMNMSKDPQEFRAALTATQQDLLSEHEMRERESYIQNVQTRIQERIEQQGLNVTRNVVPLRKVRVVGVGERNGKVEVAKAMLSIWKPCEALLEILTEGAWVDIMNVTSTAIRYSELQISAGRQSVFSLSKYVEPENHKPYLSSFIRQCYPIKALYQSTNITAEYNEVDTVGLIVEIDPEMTKFDCNKHQFQNVYLADAEKNIMCVNFWGGVNKFGFESILDTDQVISCTNLQKRSGNTRKSIPQYRATEFSYFTKTPKSVEARKIVEELSKSVNRIDKKKFCEECRSLRSNFAANRLQNNSENVTPYRFMNIDINSTKNRVFIDTPLAQRTTKTDENLNLTGLDFESTFKQADTQELSPRTLLRKRQVKEKIEKLKRYGEPPPLSPITILNKSKNAANAFKSPLISKSDSSACVASDEKIVPSQDNCETCVPTSPIVGLNKTYVKRKVNPVKLNFSANKEDTFDHFAEDFEGSPPLSLE